MLLHKSLLHDSRVRREASTLHEAGHAVTVLELAADVRPPLTGVQRVSVAPPAWIRRLLGAQAHRLLSVVSFVIAAVRSRPDVIHAHDAAMLMPGLAAAALTRAQLVYDSHELATGVPYREPHWDRVVKLVERIAVPRCASVITVSDGIASTIATRYDLQRTPAVVRNVCSLPRGDSFAGLRARLGLTDELLVLHQGAAAQDRGGEILVRAVASLPGVHLCFLGDGAPGSRESLQLAARRFGMQDRIHHVPSVPLERLLAHTAEADVGVSLLQDTCENHRLALPNKLFEYLAAGIPVVVSDLPEMGRLVKAFGVGWTADPADPKAVAAALEEALAHRDDPALLGRIADAAEQLSWAREQRSLLAVYEQLAAA